MCEELVCVCDSAECMSIQLYRVSLLLMRVLKWTLQHGEYLNTARSVRDLVNRALVPHNHKVEHNSWWLQ